jgi:hypothetical protein
MRRRHACWDSRLVIDGGALCGYKDRDQSSLRANQKVAIAEFLTSFATGDSRSRIRWNNFVGFTHGQRSESTMHDAASTLYVSRGSSSVDALGYRIRYSAGGFEAVKEEVVNVIVVDTLLPPMS